MDELWQQDKLILMIGLFQYGIISLMSLILNIIQSKVSDQVVMKTLSQDQPNAMPEQSSHLTANQLPQSMSANGEVNGEINSDIGAIVEGNNNNAQGEPRSLNVDSLTNSISEVATPYSIEISPELFKELLEISNNPAATVDEAIRWWLRRRTLDTIKSVSDRRDRQGMRSERAWKSLENSWND